MLHRWDALIGDINFLFEELKRIAKQVMIPKEETRGAKPKHPFIRYIFLIAMKEAADDSLREAEVDFSRVAYLVKRAGKLIEKNKTSFFHV